MIVCKYSSAALAARKTACWAGDETVNSRACVHLLNAGIVIAKLHLEISPGWAGQRAVQSGTGGGEVGGVVGWSS